jgi:AbrB family looped-hinge helix DNA binding protein
LSREEVAEFTAYVRREGRVTIPKELRDALIIKEGNLVKCKIIKMSAH